MTRKSTPLPSYRWMGNNALGHAVRGVLHAESIAIANVLLYKQGITVKRIYKRRLHWLNVYNHRITSKSITVFSQQLGTLLHAGLPLTDALQTLQKGEKNLAIHALVSSIQTAIKSGQSFSCVLKQYPQHFNALFCNIVTLGEQSGDMGRILLLLSDYRLQIENIQKKISKALQYPLTILSVASLVCVSLFIFVVPQFEVLFNDYHAELPFMTHCIIYISQQLKAYGLLLIALTSGLLYGLRYAYQHSQVITYYLDFYAIKLPFLGKALKNAAIARISKTLFICLNAGLPLADALSAISMITGNMIYKRAIITIQDSILRGVALHTAIETCNLFPNTVIQMITVGEESGQLTHMMARISDQYHDMLNDTATSLEHLLEPCLMILLGILVGGLIIALYLPIFQLGAIVS